MKQISFGKYRGLQQCATRHGALAILALDHRNNLRYALKPSAPESVSAIEMSSFKQAVLKAAALSASAVLLDPEYGAFQSVATNTLPGHIGLIVAIETTGYTGDPQARKSQIQPGWSVAKAKRMGASAIKLLVYYHPEASTVDAIEALVDQVAFACDREEMTFFLEPLSYSLDPAQKKLSGDERRKVVIETVRRLTRIGGDVLKAEFPLDITTEPREIAWKEACEELTASSRIPWILLSASVDYDTFLRQVMIACQAGASGVAVGRAVWQEAPSLSDYERNRFLEKVAAVRMERITMVCNALARPWTNFYTVPDAGPEFFASYAED